MIRDDFGDEAQLEALLRRDVTPSQKHAHCLLERDHPREPLHTSRTGSQTNFRLRQREGGFVGSDDDVAGKGNLEAAAHGDAVHRRNHRLFEIEAAGQAAHPARRMNR